MVNRPLFTLIIPTHKRAKLLHRALASVKTQEDLGSLEVIVISDTKDALTDQVCHELLSDKDCYIRRGGSPGPSTSRNFGLSLAQGRYVMFLDDDDAWHPDLLKNLSESYEVKQGLPVYFNCSVVTESRPAEGSVFLSEITLEQAGRLTEEVYVKNQIHMSCFAFPRELLSNLTFDPFMRAYEDWDFCLSVFDRQIPVHLPFVGSRIYEVHDHTTDRHGNSPTATGSEAVLDYLYVYRRHSSPNKAISAKRALLLKQVGMTFFNEQI